MKDVLLAGALVGLILALAWAIGQALVANLAAFGL